MKTLLKEIVRYLVDNPEEIEISEIEGQSSVVLELKVAKADLGKVIGKQGRTAQSIRSLLTAAAAKTNRRVTLEILE